VAYVESGEPLRKGIEGNYAPGSRWWFGKYLVLSLSSGGVAALGVSEKNAARQPSALRIAGSKSRSSRWGLGRGSSFHGKFES